MAATLKIVFTGKKGEWQNLLTGMSVLDLLAAHYQNDPLYRLIAQRWGKLTAAIMTKSRIAREHEVIRQRQMRQVSKSHGVHV